MKKNLRLLCLILFTAVMLVPLLADAQSTPLEIEFPFAFNNTFPGSSQHLGFPKGNVLSLGAYVIPGRDEDGNLIPIDTVTATNLYTGVELELISISVSIYYGMYLAFPWPTFNSDDHMGVWEITAEDEDGNVAVAWTHELNMEGVMPSVKDVQASGNPLAPTITWRAPKDENVPEGCRVRYILRLLKDSSNQFYQSPTLVTTSCNIPPNVLKYEDLIDTYVRIQCRCLDEADLEHPVPIELAAETFRPLQDLLFEAQIP